MKTQKQLMIQTAQDPYTPNSDSIFQKHFTVDEKDMKSFAFG